MIPSMIRSIALVLGAPLVVLALALGLTLQALQTRDQQAAAEARLARALAHPAPPPQQRGAALLVGGETPGLAASAFQARVRALATASGAEVLQLETAPPEPAPPLSRLSLTLHLRGSEAQVMAALQALEAATPLIRAARLDLRGAGQEAGPVDAQMTLQAWTGEAP